MARSAEDRRAILDRVRGLLASGAPESEQLESLAEYGVMTRELRALRSEVLAVEVEEIRAASAEETYLRYKLQMGLCVSDLDAVIKAAMADPKPTSAALGAAVAAVKAKANILDQVLGKGQDLGVIHKAPKTTMLIGGIQVSSLAVDELRALVSDKIKSLHRLAAGAPLRPYADEPDGDLYFVDANDSDDDSPPEAVDVDETPPAHAPESPVTRPERIKVR